MLLESLRKIEDRGAVETAHRVKQICGQVFRYAIATGRAERDPSADLKGALTPTKPNHMATITSPDKIGELMRAIDGYQGNLITRCALKFAPLTFVRPGELRHAEWEEKNYSNLIKRWDLLRIYLCALGSFFIFSSLFNYLPFRLSSPSFSFYTEVITFLYLVFIVGAVMGPISGRISNRYGSSTTLIGGSVMLLISLLLLPLPAITAVVIGFLGLCAGFFTIHTSAIGLLNSKLAGGEGRFSLSWDSACSNDDWYC